MTDIVRPFVQIDLPATWVRVPVAPDGDRAAQRALLADWCQGTAVDPPADLLRRLVRLSRQAHADGVAFAAVLLATVADGDTRAPITGALTVGFREAPGAPRVVAEAVLATLRRTGGPTRRTELVGLAGDPDRPAVLVQEQGVADGRVLARTEVLWPLEGRLAGVAVSTTDLPLAGAMRDVALGAVVGLSVQRVSPVNA